MSTFKFVMIYDPKNPSHRFIAGLCDESALLCPEGSEPKLIAFDITNLPVFVFRINNFIETSNMIDCSTDKGLSKMIPYLYGSSVSMIKLSILSTLADNGQYKLIADGLAICGQDPYIEVKKIIKSNSLTALMFFQSYEAVAQHIDELKKQSLIVPIEFTDDITIDN